MQLTKENYFSPEANAAFWSASQFKAYLECPARAKAEAEGTYKRPASDALMVGSYVDAFFEGTVEQFQAEHPEIFNKRTGELKSEYRKADEMIARATRDAVFMEYMRGEKQVIKTGSIDGYPFRCKFDVYLPGERIVDLKTVRDMQSQYKPGEGRVNFAQFWNWPLQLAIYQAVEGNRLPCYLAVITKEEPADIQIIEVPQHILDAELDFVKSKLFYFDSIKSGDIEAPRCGSCAYCRDTHVLEKPISLELYDMED